MQHKTKQVVVGHVSGKGRKRRFRTVKEAEAFIGTVLMKRDSDGVLRGDYYIDDCKE